MPLEKLSHPLYKSLWYSAFRGKLRSTQEIGICSIFLQFYPKRDYHKVYDMLEKQFHVTFIFADEKITNMDIMQKIISYIRSSEFSIFDITGWNPNVTLELGFAMAIGDNWYICSNQSIRT